LKANRIERIPRDIYLCIFIYSYLYLYVLYIFVYVCFHTWRPARASDARCCATCTLALSRLLSVLMYVCFCVRGCVYVYIYIHIHIRVYIYFMYCTYLHVYVSLFEELLGHLMLVAAQIGRVHCCRCVCMYVFCMCVCVHTYIYIYMYTYICFFMYLHMYVSLFEELLGIWCSLQRSFGARIVPIAVGAYVCMLVCKIINVCVCVVYRYVHIYHININK